MKKPPVILSVCIFLTISCGTKEKTDKVTYHFTRADFKEQKSLSNPEEIKFPELLNPVAFYLVNDTVVVVQNQYNCEYLLELYSINHPARPLAQLAPKGNGPNDLLSCWVQIHSNTDPYFMIHDQERHLEMQVDIRSLVKEGKLVYEHSFTYSEELHPLVEPVVCNNGSYIGYHMWYLDDSKLTNNVPELVRHSIADKQEEVQDIQSQMNPYSYFVSSVNSVCMFRNPVTQQIWIADSFRDRIRILDDSLHVQQTLIGPDQYEVTYEEVESNTPFRFVTFAGGKNYCTYIGYTFTPKHVYLLYAGSDSFDIEQKKLAPVEILKFTHEGLLAGLYKLDHYVTTLSIDSSEKHFYCTVRESIKGDEARMVKYTL